MEVREGEGEEVPGGGVEAGLSDVVGGGSGLGVGGTRGWWGYVVWLGWLWLLAGVGARAGAAATARRVWPRQQEASPLACLPHASSLHLAAVQQAEQ